MGKAINDSKHGLHEFIKQQWIHVVNVVKASKRDVLKLGDSQENPEAYCGLSEVGLKKNREFVLCKKATEFQSDLFPTF